MEHAEDLWEVCVCAKFCLKALMGRKNSEDLSEGGRIVLKLIWNKWGEDVHWSLILQNSDHSCVLASTGMNLQVARKWQVSWMNDSVSQQRLLHIVFVHNMNIYRCVDRFQCIELLHVSVTVREQKMRYSTVQQTTWSWVPEKPLVHLLRNILSIPNSRSIWPPIDFFLSKINSVQFITFSLLNICLCSCL